jgi:dihydrofolate reductase
VLIYTAITSLDGYVADARGDFTWGAPDEAVHAAVNDLERPVSTYLYGRRMYEVMVVWEAMDLAGQPALIRDYAEIWRAAEKVVHSRTLAAPSTPRTRIEREFDAEAVRELKARTEVSVGGPELAAHAFAAGLVDACHLFLAPVTVGGGKRALPDGVRLDLELLGERRFDSGFVHLHHRVLA